MLSERRLRRFVRPRQIAMLMAWRLTGRHISHIGRQFHRDPSTAWYGIRRIRDLCEHDADLAQQVREVESKLRLTLMR